MQTILTVLHVIIGVLLILVILIQSGSDELKGLGGSGVDNVISPTASANFLTRFTAILATLFIINCLVLANISSRPSRTSITDKMSKEQTIPTVTKKETKRLPIAE